MQFRNISPVGDLDIAGVGHVAHGDTFTVTADQAAGFVGQVENFEPADDEAKHAREAYDKADEPSSAPPVETAPAPATPAPVANFGSEVH